MMNLKPEELGHIICQFFNQELDTELYFDYIQTSEDVLFRFIFKNTYIDIYYKDIQTRFKSIQQFISYLFEINCNEKQLYEA